MANNLGYESLKELDEVEIIIVVDNEVDPLSSSNASIGNITTEIKRDLINKKETLEIMEYCCGAHGYSVLITGTCNGESHSVLFDAGPYGKIFMDNSRKLGIDYSKIETVVLSHWHCDHSDGLPSAIEAISKARRDCSLKEVIVDLPKDRPSRRGIKLPKSDNVMVINNPTFEELEKAGGKLVKTDESHTICSNFFYVSGKISRHIKYETGLANHVAYDETLSTWTDDPLIMEERFLVLRIKNKGLTVVTGCGHAGIVNTLLQAQNPLSDKREKYPIYLVMGGFHLAGYDQESKIEKTVRDLKALVNPAFLAPGHCSGWRCRAALEFQLHEGEAAFAGRVAPTAVGKIYNIT
ncbi:unnamed protein product [Rhizophagus irregularis]|nr:unnamed protein product [Rhizophagus irregularis]